MPEGFTKVRLKRENGPAASEERDWWISNEAASANGLLLYADPETAPEVYIFVPFTRIYWYQPLASEDATPPA